MIDATHEQAIAELRSNTTIELLVIAQEHFQQYSVSLAAIASGVLSLSLAHSFGSATAQTARQALFGENLV